MGCLVGIESGSPTLASLVAQLECEFRQNAQRSNAYIWVLPPPSFPLASLRPHIKPSQCTFPVKHVACSCMLGSREVHVLLFSSFLLLLVSCSSSSSDFAMQKFDKESEVYKMIQENKESRTAPRQSNTFRMLQEVLEADEKEAALRFPGNLSPNPPKQSIPVGGVSKHHSCEKCGTSIVTQVVRIGDDRFRHHECYTCTECGLNLRMRGHFWAGEEMFCEKHARERYHGPGTSPRATVSPQH